MIMIHGLDKIIYHNFDDFKQHKSLKPCLYSVHSCKNKNNLTMPKKCYVPGCKTGYASESKKLKLSNEKNPTLFSSPKVFKFYLFFKLIIYWSF